MLASMSRPANPYDNASCESFMRTLKREEIYANTYRDLDDLRAHVEEFIDCYYNRCRLHSALGYQTPEEFELIAAQAGSHAAASMSFFRHGETIHPMRTKKPGAESFLPPAPIGTDEPPTGYSSAGCSPAEPASASPVGYDLHGELQP